jgi:hypothetical protein
MRERDALVEAGISPHSAHRTPTALSRRRARFGSVRRPCSSSISWLNTSTSRLLTTAISSASDTSCTPWACSKACQGTPAWSGTGGNRNGAGCAAGSMPPAQPASHTASVTPSTPGNRPGTRGQRRWASQATSTTDSAAAACMARRGSNAQLPAPKPVRSWPTTIDRPTPAAKPCITEMGRKRANEASRMAPNSHWKQNASAPVTPQAASTCAAVMPSAGAEPASDASTAA